MAGLPFLLTVAIPLFLGRAIPTGCRFGSWGAVSEPSSACQRCRPGYGGAGKTAATEVKERTEDSAEEIKSKTQDAAKEGVSSARSSG
jgi:hypothetical protein